MKVGVFMVIRLAVKEDAAVVGEVHSLAWKQTYQGIFARGYIDEDSPSKRSAEFLRSIEDERCIYLLLEEDSRATGIVKLFSDGSKIEIASIYILEEFRGLGFGREAIIYIRSEYKDQKVILWVLEVNTNARAFYEKCGFVLTDRVRTISRGGEYRQLMYVSEGE